MRLNKLAGMLLLSGAVFVSCNGEALEPIRSRGNTAIIASVENDELTRTCIDPTVYKDNVTGLLWTSKDFLGVYGSSSKNAKFENTSTVKAANTTFKGTLADGETPLYCYYPYSDANDGKA